MSSPIEHLLTLIAEPLDPVTQSTEPPAPATQFPAPAATTVDDPGASLSETPAISSTEDAAPDVSNLDKASTSSSEDELSLNISISSVTSTDSVPPPLSSAPDLQILSPQEQEGLVILVNTRTRNSLQRVEDSVAKVATLSISDNRHLIGLYTDHNS